MFKKLKDKIAEEVKSSPQRLQQLTQSVTERIQNATSDESFFSIGDDDVPGSSPNPEPGFSNVSLSSYSTPNSGRLRRNSNSSVASDMSFLPRYESASNLYHLQSDLDISASEVEDNASTSSQLGHLSKEQIYAAFQKSQLRYHKYRGRYTDIANHYKELERENGKMKSVLVETQDKALRRVAELREQCSLEQKAKAHLENALRVELDEKQYVIDTLKTKVNLLQASIKNGSDQGRPELLVNVSDNSFSISDDPSEKSQDDSLDILTKDLKDARVEIEHLNEKLQEMKAIAIVYGSKEADFRKKILDLEELIKHRAQEHGHVLERERENNLIIAQTKMELHTEIQNRDLEIENLKQDVETLKSDLEQYESKPKTGKMENLQSQNTKLIEKVEELTLKCNNYESELLKTEQVRIEIQNLNKTVESFKVKIRKLEEEKAVFEEKLQGNEKTQEKLQEFEAMEKNQEVLQAKLRELKETLAEHEKTKEENIQFQEQLKAQQAEYEAKIEAYREDTKQHLLTLETKIKDKFKIEYEEKKEKITLDFQEKLQQLSKTDNNVKETQLKLMQKEEQVTNLEENLKSFEDSSKKQTEKYKDLETNHLELISESADVRNKLSGVEKENSELTNAMTSTRREISELRDSLSRLQSEICALHNEKSSLQQQYEIIMEENKQTFETNEALQCENQQLCSDNAALKTENSCSTLQSDYENLQSKNVTLQEEIVKLQTSFTKLQSENADLQNTKANLEHQILNLENDKVNLASDSSKLLTENTRLTSTHAQLTNDNEKLIKTNADLSSKNVELVGDYADACEEKTKLKSQVSDYEQSFSTLQQQNLSLQERLIEVTKTCETFQKEISQKQTQILSLQQKLTDNESQTQEKSSHSQNKLAAVQAEVAQTREELLNTKQTLEETQKSLATFENTKQNLLEKIKAQKVKFHDEITNLNKDIQGFKEKNEVIQVSIEEYKQKLTEYETVSLEKNARLQDLTTRNSDLSEAVPNLKISLEAAKAENSNLVADLEALKRELSQKVAEMQNIREESSDLSLKLQNALDENNNLKEQISQIRTDSSRTATEVISNNESLQGQLKSHVVDLKAASEENEKLKAQISRLQEVEAQLSNLHVLEDDCKKFQKEKLQLVGDLEGLRAKMLELSSENRILLGEISKWHKQEKDILKENHETKENHTKVLEEISELKRRNNELSLDYNQISHENEGLLQELAEAKLKSETLDSEKTKWEEFTRTSESEKNQILTELQDCKTEIDQLKSGKTKEPPDTDKLESENKSLKVQLGRLEEHCETCEKQKKTLEGQLRELEHQYSEITHEKQLLQDEVQELKISPINMTNHTNNAEKLDSLEIIHAEKIYGLDAPPGDVQKLQENHEKEINNLNEKLVQYKSLDLTNRSSIQFYENELQKIKNKNEKLSRKLDETLVTLNHCTDLATSTETEYLRNVLFNYMLGKEGVVLARVIAAVCKFDEDQTEAILQREQQKQTLLGQLGFR